MSKEETTDLRKFLKPFPDSVQELTWWLRDFIWRKLPDANELIYDNYNALAIGWSLSEKLAHTICGIAVYSQYIHMGFYWGSEIADPNKALQGQGNQYRYIPIHRKADLPKSYASQLIREAYANCLTKVKDPKQLCQGMTITKSVSHKKRRPS